MVIGCFRSISMRCPRASPKPCVRQAVPGSPSNAPVGRSSGQYVLVLPYAVATMRCTPTWSVVVSADDCSPGNTSSARVGRIGFQRLVGRTGLLGETDGLGHRRPAARPEPVVVGDDEHIARAGRGAQRRGRRVRARIADDTRTVEQPGAGRVDQTFTVAAHHQRVVGRLAPHDLRRIGHRVHLHRRDGRRRRRCRQTHLVGKSRREGEIGGRPVPDRRTESGRGFQHGREILGPHQVVALVVDVVARDHRADTHAAPQRRRVRPDRPRRLVAGGRSR